MLLFCTRRCPSRTVRAKGRRGATLHNRLLIILAASFASVSTHMANAQEVTLKGITSFAENTFYSRGFERFIEKVNADGKGVIQINYIGGPKAMPPFEVGNALKGGVVDIANVKLGRAAGRDRVETA